MESSEIDDANFLKRDKATVIVKFSDGTEMVAADMDIVLRCNTNDNGLSRYKPEKTWRNWEIRWAEHHEQ